MYAVTNSLAHRAPPATRTRVRWQPYNSIPSSSTSSLSSRSPSTSYLNTPSSSISSPPPANNHNDTRQLAPSAISHTTKEPQSRDTHKQKYALGLVDQAVKSLCEIWHPQDIPSVFLTSSRATVNVTPAPTHRPSELLRTTCRRNVQLPSPISPSTQESPSPLSTPSPVSRKPDSHRMNDNLSSTLNAQSCLVPIKGFVHEVLRRSRTSACVLQTALCYLEAIRSKVPELVRQERLGQGVKGEPDARNIVVADTTCDKVAEDASLQGPHPMEQDMVPTVRVSDSGSFDSGSSQDIQGLGKKLPPSPAPLPPLPPLPSPLLCPRRAFLASLILASKFTQDKCYSNRAWAKLSGLPPREIGRCERALGDALDWRLWVGKAPQSAPVQATAAVRPVVRSRSDGALLSSAPKAEITTPEHPSASHTSVPMLSSHTTSIHRGLRRCATLPADSTLDGVSFWIHDINRITKAATSTVPDSQGCGSTTSDNTWYWNSQTSVESVPSGDRAVVSIFTQSPIPATPPLTLSPSSTESSSGDRTVQMAFLDEGCSAYDSNSAPCSVPLWSETFDALNAANYHGIPNASAVVPPGFKKPFPDFARFNHCALGRRISVVPDSNSPLQVGLLRGAIGSQLNSASFDGREAISNVDITHEFAHVTLGSTRSSV